MKIVKIVGKVLLGLIVMISVLGAVCSWEINNTILKKEFVLGKMEEKNYYENLYSDILNGMKGYLAPSGLDEKILEKVITTEKIKNDTKIIIDNLYENKEETVETTEIRNNLEANIINFLQENNLKVNDKESIEEFKDKIVEEYEKGINYHIYTKYGKKVSFYELQTKLKKVESICLIGIAFSVLGYLLLDFKNSYKGMTCILACGMIISATGMLIRLKIKIDHIMLLNDAISIMVREITKNIIHDIIVMGGILMAISLLIIIGETLRKEMNNKK